jgi:hypothetical protein
MPTLQDLKISILKMSNEGAFELVKSVRFERRQAPKKSFRKSAKKKGSVHTIDISTLMKGMSAEQRLKLINELEGLK